MLNKISTHNLLRIAVTLMTIVMCLSLIFCNLDYHNNDYINETDFTYHQTQNRKYDTNISPSLKYQTGKIIVASNYSEYQNIIKKYEIIRTKELTEENFKSNNYIYVIMGESACEDDFQYHNFQKVDNYVTLNFTINNCGCTLSSLRTRAYEILVPKDITNKNQFNLSFIETKSEDICNI